MGKYKVVLDPGHGQYDNQYPAAEGYFEGTQMFKLALMLRKKLESAGIDVIVTRTKVSDNPTLAVRGSTAGNNDADMFISLHSDAVGSYVSTSANGVSVYYSIQDAAENKKFATNLSSAVAALMNTRNRGPMTRLGSNNLDYYGVIRNSAASGCKRAFLIEHGFHTNPEDVKWLINDDKLAQIADTDARIICDWFDVAYNGSSTGNSATVVPPADISSTEKYAVYVPIPKYTNAAAAMIGDTTLSTGMLAVGEYYIYKTYQGSYNLTKTVGTAGAWINPADNIKAEAPTSPDEVLSTETYEVYKPVKKYESAQNALAMINNVGAFTPGTYYVHESSSGMLNLSTDKTSSGYWMNPAQNIYTAFSSVDSEGKEVTLEVGDFVIFRTGFIPKYGNNGSNIPLSVIAEICGKKSTAVASLLKRTIGSNEIEYEAKLDSINSWVPIKYLMVIRKGRLEEPGESTEKPVEPTEPPVTDDTENTEEDVSALKDPKYLGIINAIKSGLMSEFLNDVINELCEDDVLADRPDAYELIFGTSVATAEELTKFVRGINPNFDEKIADAFIRIGKEYGIRGDVAFCQSILETGWFKYEGGTAVTPEQHNYCGLGVTSLGVTGNSFPTIEIGVEAQMQHLYAYACTNDLPKGKTLYDPRFNYVNRGSAPRWVDLDGKWCTGTGYGEKILDIWARLTLTQ